MPYVRLLIVMHTNFCVGINMHDYRYMTIASTSTLLASHLSVLSGSQTIGVGIWGFGGDRAIFSSRWDINTPYIDL